MLQKQEKETLDTVFIVFHIQKAIKKSIIVYIATYITMNPHQEAT